MAIVERGNAAASGAEPCRIEVVEKESGWPVPLVELTTTHHVTLITDNAGVVAVNQPELLGREVFFTVESDGYEVPKDGFGYRGVRLVPQHGKTLKIEVNRTMIARRLGRLTGAGQFAESQLTGRDRDWRETGVFGCDSVQTAVHDGTRYWLWGDTTLPRYPLGIFDSSGATSDVLPLKNFEPPLRLHFEMFRDKKGNLRGITPMAGKGPTWATAMVDLPDRDGKKHLVCTYMKVHQNMEAYEWGLAVWNDKSQTFEKLKVIWSHSADAPKPPPLPQGHAVPWRDADGRDWILFAHPFPALRCPASFEAWQNPSSWEPLEQQRTVQAADGSEEIRPHRGVHVGGIGWHPWRKRWVTVFQQSGGKPSPFGELWYAEADAPTGPWGPAVKVLSHRNYTFYNPCLHLDFTPTNSPVLLFEGTYTAAFSGNSHPTPRYDYNQMLYRLDLDDPRLRPAQKP
ncbi:hypothetical protein GC207_00340 [bacterium]|nr:hypothetical protein [bacterium]